jgi:hypothetical protein
MDKYLAWCINYLEGQGFWHADFGNYCFGDKENTVGISISKKDDYLHISTIKFPECNNSPSFFIYAHPEGIDQTGIIKLLLDVLIFTIKSYEQ